MGEWSSALLFGLFLITFTLGMSNFIMMFIPPQKDNVIRSQIEYGFLGASGLVFSLLFVYLLM